MPPIAASALLRPALAGELDGRVVKVVVPFGMHRMVYTVPTYCVQRVVRFGALRADAVPTQWIALQSKSNNGMPGPTFAPAPPDDTPLNLRGTGYTLLYKTAGAYFNSLGAEEELKHLPQRGGKKTAVVTSDDERADAAGLAPPPAEEEDDDAAASDASSDTSLDSDGQPKPKKPKRKKPAKPRGRRKVSVQKPAHMEYRKLVRSKQSLDVTPVYSADHLGEQFCMVLAQLLREFTRVGNFTPETCAFLHPQREWLEALAEQARVAGNDRLAHAAHRLLEPP